MHLTEACFSTNRRRPRKFRCNPRPRGPLFRDYSRPEYPYSTDSDECESLFSASSDSISSYLSEYPIRRLGYRTLSSPRRVMSSIRPRTCLADFLDLFNGRSKVTRRTRARRNSQGYRFRAFVVDPPEDSSVEDLPLQRPTARGRPFPRRVDPPSFFEPQRRDSSRIGRPSVPRYQQPRVPRPARERTPVTERVPARPGRRVSPVRSTVTREPMPRRIHRYRLTREVDHGGVGTFRPGPMPRMTRRSSAMPRTPVATFREDYPSYGIPIPARETFSYSARAPEPIRITCRSPRAPARERGWEERYRPRNVRFEERWPQDDPPIVEAGYLRSSTAGARIFERARARPGYGNILLETRSPRAW